MNEKVTELFRLIHQISEVDGCRIWNVWWPLSARFSKGGGDGSGGGRGDS